MLREIPVIVPAPKGQYLGDDISPSIPLDGLLRLDPTTVHPPLYLCPARDAKPHPERERTAPSHHVLILP